MSPKLCRVGGHHRFPARDPWCMQYVKYGLFGGPTSQVAWMGLLVDCEKSEYLQPFICSCSAHIRPLFYFSHVDDSLIRTVQRYITSKYKNNTVSVNSHPRPENRDGPVRFRRQVSKRGTDEKKEAHTPLILPPFGIVIEFLVSRSLEQRDARSLRVEPVVISLNRNRRG